MRDYRSMEQQLSETLGLPRRPVAGAMPGQRRRGRPPRIRPRAEPPGLRPAAEGGWELEFEEWEERLSDDRLFRFAHVPG